MSEPGVETPDVKCTIEIQAGPSGTSRIILMFLKGFGAVHQKEEGIFSLAIFPKYVPRIREGLLTIPGRFNTTFVQHGKPFNENGGAPSGASGGTGELSAGLHLARLHEAPPPAPAEFEATEGTSVPWPYGSEYRRIDEQKLDAIARKRRTRKEGKLKIQLGPNSDHQYLVEPNRDSRGGWIASKMLPVGDRIRIAEDPNFNRVIFAIQKYERDSAKVSNLMAVARVDPPPVPRGITTTTPATETSPTLVPAADREHKVSWWQLGEGTNTRWALTQEGRRLEHDTVEMLFRMAHALGLGSVVVVGWNGAGPEASEPVSEPPTEAEPTEEIPQISDAMLELADDLTDLGRDLLK